MSDFLAALYILLLSLISIYGVMGLLTLWLYWRHRQEQFPAPPVAPADWPTVTVQLPIYNEQYVVERLLKTAVSLNYPPDKLHIQLIDDSTDETSAIAARLIADYQQQGVNINFLHRDNRDGYKAGALAAALPQTDSDFIAIFDADFAPRPDFLRQTIPHFLAEPKLGMVQSRWEHLNADFSALTGAQAIALDKHFGMEQVVRHRADLFPKFNGAGGVWRRECMIAVGGWHDDTVCEDLCLSTRAILDGWQFRFLTDVTAPAELPTSVMAYKSQQARWSKGSTQCLRKYGKAIMKNGRFTLIARLYAVLSMSAYITQPLLLGLLLLQIPLLWLNYHFSPYMLLFTFAGLGQPILFIMGQQTLHTDWKRRLRHFPAMLLLAIGTAPSNSRAIWQALFGHDHPFVRTPKRGDGNSTTAYRPRFDKIFFVEIFFALYAAFGIYLIISRQNMGPLFFLLTCISAFSYIAWLGWQETKV